MATAWDLVESGPPDAASTVLLLPGGLNRARSYTELMAEPALADVHLVAATLPGHAGTPPPDDFSIEHYSRTTGELAHDVDADVVVGFSIGATVALQMVASSAFTGPVVLLGISPSLRDEPMFLRALDRLAVVFGHLPYTAMRAMVGMATKSARVSDERRAELTADLRANDPATMRRIFHGYLEFLARDDNPARRLCDAGVPAWVVHAEKGDGDLTEDERQTLEACPHVSIVTIPGSSFLLPNEEPARIADLVVTALDRREHQRDA